MRYLDGTSTGVEGDAIICNSEIINSIPIIALLTGKPYTSFEILVNFVFLNGISYIKCHVIHE